MAKPMPPASTPVKAANSNAAAPADKLATPPAPKRAPSKATVSLAPIKAMAPQESTAPAKPAVATIAAGPVAVPPAAVTPAAPVAPAAPVVARPVAVETPKPVAPEPTRPAPAVQAAPVEKPVAPVAAKPVAVVETPKVDAAPAPVVVAKAAIETAVVAAKAVAAPVDKAVAAVKKDIPAAPMVAAMPKLPNVVELSAASILTQSLAFVRQAGALHAKMLDHACSELKATLTDAETLARTTSPADAVALQTKAFRRGLEAMQAHLVDLAKTAQHGPRA